MPTIISVIADPEEGDEVIVEVFEERGGEPTQTVVVAPGESWEKAVSGQTVTIFERKGV